MFAVESSPAPTGAAARSQAATPERIGVLTEELTSVLTDSIRNIAALNTEASVLSLNARLEAARAGDRGAAFGIVAEAMSKLSNRTGSIAREMDASSRTLLGELNRLNIELATQHRGERLSDLALVAIELIDRNLYERSCDVRWWATDASCVDALTNPTPTTIEHACRRLGVILDSYTVYFDIVLADRNGRVIANGRPRRFPSIDRNCADTDWFRSAMATNRGDQFGFESVRESMLVGGERTLVYSCAVREQGQVDGRALGTLGIIFNWDALAQTIVENVPFGEAKGRCRAMVVDPDGTILADSWKRRQSESVDGAILSAVMDEKKNYALVDVHARRWCVGHAFSPGFETYATGWHALAMVAIGE